MFNLNAQQQATLAEISGAASSYALQIARHAKSLIDTATRIHGLAKTAAETANGVVDAHIALLEQSKQEIHTLVDEAVTILDDLTGGDFHESLGRLHDVTLARANAKLDADIESIATFDDSIGVEDDEEADPRVTAALLLVSLVTGIEPAGWEPFEDGNGIRVFLNEDHTQGVDARFV